ncbi:MAG TPA: DUF3592 domain-containing protein [Terriglobales bacterium]|nr:DUF3592 domain-containing protein [Terriglobales bacterium]
MSVDSLWWLGLARDLLIFVFASGAGVTLWLRKRSASVWPDAFGKVESVSSHQVDLVWRTDIAYSYSVGSQFFSGHFQVVSRSEKKASAQERRWKGQNIRVRYSPKDAQVSVVRMEDQVGLLPTDAL